MNQKPKNNLKDEIKRFVIKWNNDFPIDRWWRQKHSVAFGSEAHKKADFIQMFLEYEEDSIIATMRDSRTKETSEFVYNDGIQISQEQLDKDFDNFDIDDYE